MVNGLVTALHELLQPNEELEVRDALFSTHLAEFDDHSQVRPYFEQYGRNPRDVRKFYQRRGSSLCRGRQSCPSGSRELEAFAEARGRIECYKCGGNWNPKHVCAPGAIISKTCSKLNQGHTHVHTSRNLPNGMERDARANAEYDSSMREGAIQESNNGTDVETVRELDEAPSPTSAGRAEDVLLPEAMDEHIVTHMFSAAMARGTPGMDFQ